MAIEYERIPKILKRYSFEEKMKICNYISQHFMDGFKLNIFNKKVKLFSLEFEIYPWELEILAMFSTLEKENDDKNFDNQKGQRQLIRIFKSIREYIHPLFKQDPPTINMFIPIALTQFKLQEDFRYRLYRYNYFFSFINKRINMVEVFKSEFENNYDELYIPMFIMFFLSINNKNINEYLFKKYHSLIRKFTISREKFIQKQTMILNNGIDSSYYAFKYFFRYPFVSENHSAFLPLPHLLIYAVTDSLLNLLTGEDITDEKKRLRELIGKEVIESYLFDILYESNAYTEIEREIIYKTGKGEISSPDVMVYCDEICILFDTKALSPSLLLRDMDEEKIGKITEICADNVKKTYNRINEFGNNYQPFKYRKNFNKENIFGVIVLLEDNYIYRPLIYKKVDENSGFVEGSVESNYIRSNIKIVCLQDIEEVTFYSKNYADGLVINRNNKTKWYDFTMNSHLKDSCMQKPRINSLENFIKSLMNQVSLVTKELYDNEILKE